MNRLRAVLGAALRRHRHEQGKTLRQVADAAGVSLTYLSEVERGVKEASSEILEAVCTALGLLLPDLLFEVAETLARLEGPRGERRPAGFHLPEREPARIAKVIDFRAYAGRRPA